jgi:hypothetical protein
VLPAELNMSRLEFDLLGLLEGIFVVHILVNISSTGITTSSTGITTSSIGITTSVCVTLIHFGKTITINGQLGELALHK